MDDLNLSPDKKMEIVILGLAPRANIDGICRRYGITHATFRDMRQKFLEGAREALSRDSRDTREIRLDLEASREALKKFIPEDPPS